MHRCCGEVYYTINGSRKSFTVNDGSYSIGIDPDLSDNAQVTFTYTQYTIEYSVTKTLREWKQNKNLVLVSNKMTGTIEYGRNRIVLGWTGDDMPQNANVTCSSGSMQIVSEGRYVYTPGSATSNIRIEYRSGSYTYSETFDLSELVNKHIRLKRQ